MKNVLYSMLFTSSLFFAVSGYAQAETLIVYGLGSDVSMSAKGTNWSTAQQALVGENLQPENWVIESFAYTYSNTSYIIYRAFFNFDTSEIPDNAVITDAKLNIFVDAKLDQDNDEYAYMGAYHGLPDSASGVVASDFSKCGEVVNNPVLGSTPVDITGVTEEEYLTFNINASGRSWINTGGLTSFCLRDGHDAENVPIVGGPYTYSGLRMYSANEVGTNKDPYLIITYEIEDETNYPLYTQIESDHPSVEATSDWSDDLYADGATSWCGNTIGGCGCVISSLVMAGRNAGLETDVLGGDVNPKNINAYLQSVGGYASGGSVSWLAASAYLGEINSGGKLASRFASAPERPSSSAETMSLIDSALIEGNNAVLAYKNGHFLWVPEKTATSYIVRDPWWYDTLTADDVDNDQTYVRDYDNTFTDARIIKIHDEPVEFSGTDIEAHLTSETAQLLFTNVAGEVGYSDGTVVVDLDRASYGNTEVIALDGAPVDANAGKHLLVYEAGSQFTIDVIGTDVGEFKLEFFTIDEYGGVKAFEFVGLTLPGMVTTFTFDLEAGTVTEQPISYEYFISILEHEMEGYSLQQRKFFIKWAEKIFENAEEKKSSQLLKSMEVFKKLLGAKEVDSTLLYDSVDLIAGERINL
jgi:hypothetical protein